MDGQYYDSQTQPEPNNADDIYREDVLTGMLNYKYDAQAEQEVVNWINNLLSERIPLGKNNVYQALRSGEILAKLINLIFQNTPNLPPASRQVPLPIRYHASNLPFKQMENIQMFLNCTELYGVPRTSLFQTVDLFEGRNIALVISCLMQLGTACQKNGFMGPTVGPRPSAKTPRFFTSDQMRAGEGIIGLQAGTNKFASQKGMSFGAQRHVGDIKVEDITPSGAAVIGLQAGTNKFATQTGMNFGAQRHVGDIKVESATREGSAVIGLQMGTNRFATQSGMTMGTQRHISDLKFDGIQNIGGPGQSPSASSGYYSAGGASSSGRSREQTPKSSMYQSQSSFQPGYPQAYSQPQSPPQSGPGSRTSWSSYQIRDNAGPSTRATGNDDSTAF